MHFINIFFIIHVVIIIKISRAQIGMRIPSNNLRN